MVMYWDDLQPILFAHLNTWYTNSKAGLSWSIKMLSYGSFVWIEIILGHIKISETSTLCMRS